MEKDNRVFQKLFELTGQKSGVVVCEESGEVVVCDWTRSAGLPCVFSNEIIGSDERLFLSKVRYVDDIGAEIDKGRIVYDAYGDTEKLCGASATAHFFVNFERGTDVCVVYTPQGWN